MANLAKEIAAFKDCRSTYDWRDFVRLLGMLGYDLVKSGKTGGSRRKYYNSTTGHMIFADEPHDGEMGRGMVKRLQRDLEGVI